MNAQMRMPDRLLRVLQRCIDSLCQVKQVHSLLITNGHLVVADQWSNTLLYNTLIRAYLNLSTSTTVLTLFVHMLRHQAPPNSHTFPSLLKAAAKVSRPYGSCVGYYLYGQCSKRGVLNDPFVRTSFLSLYSQVGDMRSAGRMFAEIPRPCVVSYNTMIDAFVKNGDMRSAAAMFMNMSERDVYSWTSVINGYARNGKFSEAIGCFTKMMVDQDVIEGFVRPNEATFVSVLSSCANLDISSGLHHGKQIHGYLIRSETEFTVFIGTALVSFYGRMACLNHAFTMFESMAVKQACCWNAMICSLASNGRERESLDMFEKMKNLGFRPNEVTFVGVLTACARIQLVDLGLELFKSMSNEYAITPRMEHYGCVVDLLGRAGLLKEAFQFVQSMPIKADGSVWGALLGACRVHGDVELGKEVGRHVIELQPHRCGRYVLLSNIYAGADVWDHAAAVRREMVDAGVQKVPAGSTA